MTERMPVGILGATGMVGQKFVSFLQDHPWFEITWLGASDRSAGKKYRDATSWRLNDVMPPAVREIVVNECVPDERTPRLVFSATDASVATEIERAFALSGRTVVSNSRNYRMEDDVPLLVPEINPEHLKLLAGQQRRREWPGQIVTNPNCSTAVMVMALAPLKQFGLKRVIVTTMQAISGAGYPGVASMDINANVIPFIGGEEEKMERETQKILGDFSGDFNGSRVEPLAARVSASCNRVPVVDGHLMSVSIELEKRVSEAEILGAWRGWRGIPQQKGLPSAPPCPVIYMDEPDRPQPRRDAERENGMAVFVGRLRRCPVLDFKFLALGHNTVRGAAGAAVLNAELMKSEGYL